MGYHLFRKVIQQRRNHLMAQVKYILLLPLNYNDKTKVPKKVRKKILDDLYCLANGYHINGKAKGAYRMKSGQKKVDWSLEIWVAVAEEDEEALKQMVAGFAKLLGQESIYLERVNSTVEFIPPSAEGGSGP